jgi:hypothetical protein
MPNLATALSGGAGVLPAVFPHAKKARTEELKVNKKGRPMGPP